MTRMAKEKQSVINDSIQVKAEQPTATEVIIAHEESKEVLIGLEAFASAKDLHWTVKTRLTLYAEQNKVTEKTFNEWEKILAQS